MSVGARSPGFETALDVRSRPAAVQGIPLFVAFGGFVVWWALGLGPFIWPIVAVGMALAMLDRGEIRAPAGFGLWLLFLMWVLGSYTQLDPESSGLMFAYRFSLYAAAGIVFLYVYNLPRDAATDRRLVLAMVVFWMTVTAGGFLGVVAPTFGFTSLLERILPKRIAANVYFYDLIHPAAAQIQNIFGYESARPKAPFEYTNVWGAVFALSTPFLVAGWAVVHTSLWRWAMRVFALAAVVPVVLSLNRGLWVSLGLGLVYAGVRMAAAGQTRAVFGLTAVFVLVATIALVTPLRGVIEARLTTEKSIHGRETIYSEAAHGVVSSPLFGYGAPRTSETDPNLPQVGTHGQLWLVLYSHGIPALALFVGWMLVLLWRTRRPTTPIALWCHVVIVISIIQLPFYLGLPAQLQVVMVAAAIALRQIESPPHLETRSRPAMGAMR